MASLIYFAPLLKRLEGGYAGNIDGKTCTMKGITLEVYQKHFGKQKTCSDLKRISDNEWYTITKTDYWDVVRADEIVNQSVANIIVDFVFNSGKSVIKRIQKIVGVVPDGIFGKKTLAAINNADQKELFYKIKASRKAFYDEIIERNPSKAKFKRGWYNRLNSFKFAY